MFNSVTIQWDALLTNVGIALLVVLLGLAVFYLLWLLPHGFHFEEGHYNFEGRRGNQTGSQTVTTFGGYYKRMSMILKDMDHEYWIKVAGMDGTTIIANHRLRLRAVHPPDDVFADNFLHFRCHNLYGDLCAYRGHGGQHNLY